MTSVRVEMCNKIYISSQYVYWVGEYTLTACLDRIPLSALILGTAYPKQVPSQENSPSPFN